MARQKSIIKLEGTIGDLTFYRSGDGYIARERTSLSGDRIASDPKFERTRENGQEFGNAGKAGKLLRKSLRSLILQAGDPRVTGRLTGQLVKVLQSDTTGLRGQRQVAGGDLSMLEGFEFNKNAQLEGTFHAAYQVVADRPGGKLTLTIPAFDPKEGVTAPAGATHFKLVSAGTELDFATGKYVTEVKESAVVDMGGGVIPAINHVHSVPANSVNPLCVALSILFYQEVNGQHYPLKSGAFNPLSLVKVVMS